MRLIILSQYYPPEIGAPQARLSELVRRFVARGHSVTVVTAMPNYPVGRIHEGYGGLLRRESRDGASVIRTPIYPSRAASLVPRLLSYCSFAASSAIVAPAFLRKADFLLVESPPLFLGPTAWWLSRLSRARLIFNVSDLWPESAVHVGMLRRESAAFGMASKLEAFCYRKAWLVTGQSRTIVADIGSRFPGVRTYHLSNGADTRRFHPGAATVEARAMLGGPAGRTVLYAGLHGLAQGLDQLVEAATRLQAIAGLRFILVGDGPDKAHLVDLASDRHLTNMTFLPPLPFADMPSTLAAADIIFVSLKSDIPGAVPSKLYEAMASGRPIVFVGGGEAAEVVRRSDAGIVVAPGDMEGLAVAIRRLATGEGDGDRLAVNARRSATRDFDRDTICGRFIDYLEAA